MGFDFPLRINSPGVPDSRLEVRRIIEDRTNHKAGIIDIVDLSHGAEIDRHVAREKETATRLNSCAVAADADYQ